MTGRCFAVGAQLEPFDAARVQQPPARRVRSPTALQAHGLVVRRAERVAADREPVDDAAAEAPALHPAALLLHALDGRPAVRAAQPLREIGLVVLQRAVPAGIVRQRFAAGKAAGEVGRVDLPRGAMIGTARVLEVLLYGEVISAIVASRIAEEQRRWTFGPLCIVLGDVRALPAPVECRGMLGFWTVPATIAPLLEELAA